MVNPRGRPREAGIYALSHAAPCDRQGRRCRGKRRSCSLIQTLPTLWAEQLPRRPAIFESYGTTPRSCAASAHDEFNA